MLKIIDNLAERVNTQCELVNLATLSPEQWCIAEPSRMTVDVVSVISAGSSRLWLDGAEYVIQPGTVVFLLKDITVRRELLPPATAITVLWTIFSVNLRGQLRLAGLLPPPFCLTGATAEEIAELEHRLWYESRQSRPGHALIANGLMLQMLAAAYRAPEDEVLQPERVLPCTERQADQRMEIAWAVQCIVARYAEPLTCTTIAESACLHPQYFAQLFRQATGVSPMKFLEQTRIEEARRLLLNTMDHIHDIAAAVGYPDPYHFSRVFRRVAGESPSAFREQGRRLQALGI